MFDVDATHKGKDNTYSFWWHDKKIVLMPSNGDEIPNASQVEGMSFLALTEEEFVKHVKEANGCTALMVKGAVEKHSSIPQKLEPLLAEFADLIPSELPIQLPPMRDIQHHMLWKVVENFIIHYIEPMVIMAQAIWDKKNHFFS